MDLYLKRFKGLVHLGYLNSLGRVTSVAAITDEQLSMLVGPQDYQDCMSGAEVHYSNAEREFMRNGYKWED